jgi:hypothetical protein
MQVGGPCGMDERIADSLLFVANHYASRHDSIDHKWMKILGFLTGRVGNHKDLACMNRNVLDMEVHSEQLRDDRGGGVVYHTRDRQQWIPGVHATASPANAGRPCRYGNDIIASAALSPTQTSLDYDMTALYQYRKLILSATHHPWLVYPEHIRHLQPTLQQTFRQIGASKHSSILELLRQTVLTSDCFEERTDLAQRICRELMHAENHPARVNTNEFKTCVLMIICCTGLANIGGVDSTAILMSFFWEPGRDTSQNDPVLNPHVDADKIRYHRRQNYWLIFSRFSWSPIGHTLKANDTSGNLWTNRKGSTHCGPILCKAARRGDAERHFR